MTKIYGHEPALPVGLQYFVLLLLGWPSLLYLFINNNGHDILLLIALICACWTSHYILSPPYCHSNLHSLGRVSTRFWNVAVGNSVHSAGTALIRSYNDVGQEGLAHSLCSRSSQMFSGAKVGLRSGLCAGHLRFSTPTLPNHVFMDLCAQRHCHTGKGLG